MKAKRAAADEKNCAACVRPFIYLKRALLSLEFLFLPSSLVVSSSALSVFFSVSQHVLFLLLYPLCGTRKGEYALSPVLAAKHKIDPALFVTPSYSASSRVCYSCTKEIRYPYTIYLGPNQEDARALCPRFLICPFSLFLLFFLEAERGKKEVIYFLFFYYNFGVP